MSLSKMVKPRYRGRSQLFDPCGLGFYSWRQARRWKKGLCEVEEEREVFAHGRVDPESRWRRL